MRLETYIWSADLGEVKDFTAVAALKVERTKAPGDRRGAAVPPVEAAKKRGSRSGLNLGLGR